jgi:hypothetical protein
MSEVHGEKPRPWAIVVRPPDDEALQDLIREIVPTVRFVDADGMERVRQQDYDLAIVFGDAVALLDHLFVVQFGGNPVSARSSAGPHANWIWTLQKYNGAYAERFAIGDAAVERDVRTLAIETAIPEPGSSYLVMDWRPNVTDPTLPAPKISSFVSEMEGLPIAGSVRRSPDPSEESELWFLPDLSGSHADEWVDAALTYWRRAFPDRFPTDAPDWTHQAAWMTSAEVDAQAAVEAMHERARVEIQRLSDQTEELQQRRDEAGRAADLAERRLVTAQDEDLVDEVATALRELGFEVLDADALPEYRSAKQEDLRVLLGDWICLAEIKGYARRNARATDLLQLGKAVETFILREKRIPDARWYIVNQSYSTPPADRRRPLQGTDLGTFEASGGLVIDTRDLFQLREAVRLRKLDQVEAQQLLKSATGILEYPAS